MNDRRIEPEILDELPADDPEAQASRRDLRRINRLMGHGRLFRKAWKRSLMRASGPVRVVELGAGDGAFLAEHLPTAANGSELILVDQTPALDAATRQNFADKGWALQVLDADVFEALEGEALDCDLMFANLFLHHFDTSALKRLFARASKLSVRFIALEPRRNRFALALAAAGLPLIGCNRVTRHDAKVSVRAGFRARELSQLWPRSQQWQLLEQRRGLFTHAFTASIHV